MYCSSMYVAVANFIYLITSELLILLGYREFGEKQESEAALPVWKLHWEDWKYRAFDCIRALVAEW